MLASALIWGIIIVRRWAPAAAARGGRWYLEAVLFLAAPISSSLVALYPRDGSFSGPFPAANSVVAATAVVLSGVGFVQALRNPRFGGRPLLYSLAFFYVTLVLSGFGGLAPGVPMSYLVTPLAVIPFVLHGGYSYEWLINTSKLVLRTVLCLSAVALVVIPEAAFNIEESRTLFGLERVQGITLHPNSLGILAVMLLYLEIHSRSRSWWKLLALVSILLAQSATAYVIAIVGFAVLHTPLSRIARSFALLGALAAAFLTLVNPAATGQFLAEVLPANMGTLNGRTRIWAAAMNGFGLSPVWGYGPSFLDDEFRASYLQNFDAAAQAHNQWIQTLGSTGAVGAVSLVILALVVAIYGWMSRTASRGLTLALVLLLFLRSITESPLRPSGIASETVLAIVILGILACAPRDKPVSEPAGMVKSGPSGEEPPYKGASHGFSNYLMLRRAA